MKVELDPSCVEKFNLYREDIEYNFDVFLIQSDSGTGFQQIQAGLYRDTELMLGYLFVEINIRCGY